MKLYHGTTEDVARLALEEGLLPREETGIESHWDTCPSREDMVYLTRAYAPYFAFSATEKDERWGLIEIDTDLILDGLDGKLDRYLYPDEDFLEQASRRGNSPCPEGLSMEARTQWFREHLLDFQHYWKDSVDGLGNCACYGAVPVECITRIVLYDPNKNRTMSMFASDPTISLINYSIMGQKYRAFTDWMFGATLTPFEFDPTLSQEAIDLFPAFKKIYDHLEEALADRSGIEMVEA